MFLFDSITPKEFTLLSTLLGLLLISDLNTDEQNSFGNFLVSIGQTLLTNAAQEQNIKACCENQRKYEDLSKQISLLNEQLSDLKKHKY